MSMGPISLGQAGSGPGFQKPFSALMDGSLSTPPSSPVLPLSADLDVLSS